MLILKFYIKFQHISPLKLSKVYKSKYVSVLTSLLDVPYKKVKTFKKEHSLLDVEESQMESVITFCQSVDISKEQIKEHINLLKMKVRTLDSQYTLLKEMGFTKVDAAVLAKYRTCMNHPISILKLQNLIPEGANVAVNLLSHLQPKPHDLRIEDLSDENLLRDVHKILLVRYLMWRLNASEEKVEKLLRQRATSIRSFRFLCESFALAADLGILEDKIIQHGYILSSYPKYPLTTITQTPEICGVKMVELYQRCPKLLNVTPQNIAEIKEILEERNIDRESLRSCANVLMLSPTTIRLRFDELESVPELKIMKNHPRILNLILQHNKARSRLSFLQSIKLQCASFGLLNDNPDSFDAHVRQGIDENSLYDVRRLLQDLLGINYKEFEKDLRKHPFFLKVPLFQIQDTFQYLRGMHYENSSIIKVIQILLYPKEKINRAFRKIQDDNHLRLSYLTDVQKLNLALYFMEKKHHFTGNGIWKNN